MTSPSVSGEQRTREIEAVLRRLKELSVEAHDPSGGRYGPVPTLGDFDSAIRCADGFAAERDAAVSATDKLRDALNALADEILTSAFLSREGVSRAVRELAALGATDG